MLIQGKNAQVGDKQGFSYSVTLKGTLVSTQMNGFLSLETSHPPLCVNAENE